MNATIKPLILVAEDDTSDEHLLQWAFTKAEVKAAFQFVHDGAEAMDYLLGIPPYHDRSKYPFPDLLIVDLRMPRVDGFELLAWLRKMPGLVRLPVGVMSGPSWEQDFERARALRADFFLSKWLEFSELVQAIKTDVKPRIVHPPCLSQPDGLLRDVQSPAKHRRAHLP